MAIMPINKGDGLTSDMCEALRKDVNWEGNPRLGIIFHAASLDESGNICVADVWESEENWKNFLDTSLKPFTQKAICLLQRHRFFKSITFTLSRRLTVTWLISPIMTQILTKARTPS